MGEKTVMIIGSLCVVNFIINVIGVFLPMHVVSFLVVGAVKVFQFRTQLTHMTVVAGPFSTCESMRVSSVKLLNDARNRLADVCEKMSGDHSIQEVASYFCTPVVERMYPEACTGLQHAYLVGLLVVATLFVSSVVQFIACYLLWGYTATSKRKHREVAFYLMIGCAVTTFLILVIYGFATLWSLDEMGRFSLIGTNLGSGVYIGYFILWVGALLQAAILGLFIWVKQPEEAIREQLKETEEFVAACGAYGGNQSYKGSGWGQGQGQGVEMQPYPCNQQGGADQAAGGWGPQQGSYGGQQGSYGGQQGSYGGQQPGMAQWG